MNIDDLTIKQARELAAMFKDCGFINEESEIYATKTNPGVTAELYKSILKSEPRPVIVTTDKRAVVFGMTTNTNARPIVLTEARMCLFWSADVGGVFGLAEVGPTPTCKISAVVPSIALEGVTAIMSVDPKAEKAWKAAKVQGRKDG